MGCVENRDLESLTLLKLSVLSSHHQANFSLIDRVCLFSHRDTGDLFEKRDYRELGQRAITTKEAGSNQITLFVYENVLVEIQSWLGATKVESYARLVEQFLRADSMELVEKIDLPKPSIIAATSASVGKCIRLNVKVWLNQSSLPLDSSKFWLIWLFRLLERTSFTVGKRLKHITTVSRIAILKKKMCGSLNL